MVKGTVLHKPPSSSFSRNTNHCINSRTGYEAQWIKFQDAYNYWQDNLK